MVFPSSTVALLFHREFRASFGKHGALENRNAPDDIDIFFMKRLYELLHIGSHATFRHQSGEVRVFRFEREISAEILDINNEAVQFGFFNQLHQIGAERWRTGNTRGHVDGFDRSGSREVRHRRLWWNFRRLDNPFYRSGDWSFVGRSERERKTQVQQNEEQNTRSDKERFF